MYYMLYLASLCQRRRWQEPSYESVTTPTGHTCIVRVNNREYTTDMECASDVLARENAAMRAYLICRNFSVNDGMVPPGHGTRGTVQGIPVAIGTGRKRDDDESSSGGSWSGSLEGGWRAGSVSDEDSASGSSGSRGSSVSVAVPVSARVYRREM